MSEGGTRYDFCETSFILIQFGSEENIFFGSTLLFVWCEWEVASEKNTISSKNLRNFNFIHDLIWTKARASGVIPPPLYGIVLAVCALSNIFLCTQLTAIHVSSNILPNAGLMCFSKELYYIQDETSKPQN